MKLVPSETKIRIREVAQKLFFEKGFDDTSINQIMRETQLAKGTFYLYYKDKAALIEEVMISKHIDVLETLIASAYTLSLELQIPWQNAFIKLLIKHHCQHPQVLRLITHNVHNISTDYMKQTIYDNTARLSEFIDTLAHGEEDMRTLMNRFFLILEISGVVCYNAIYFHHPDDMDQVEDLLYQYLSVKGESA